MAFLPEGGWNIAPDAYGRAVVQRLEIPGAEMPALARRSTRHRLSSPAMIHCKLLSTRSLCSSQGSHNLALLRLEITVL